MTFDFQSPASAALRKRRPDEAARILGHYWNVSAPVEHGDARGRTMGFPTANMHLEDGCPLAFGVYAVRVILPAGVRHDGVANFGIRPMYRTARPLLEAHLFDFDGDLYGQVLTVEIVAWLRGEESFSGLDALIKQIQDDAALARQILAREAEESAAADSIR
jgi:riboflavin kinase/FMN adenylyltransferase